MIIITYKDRSFIDRFKCIDRINTLRAFTSFDSGGLRYYKVNEFDYKVIEKDMIVREEVIK